jgi:hypothetical protein
MITIIIAGIQYHIHTTESVIKRLQNAWDMCWFLSHAAQIRRSATLNSTLHTDFYQNLPIQQTWTLYLKSCAQVSQFTTYRKLFFPQDRIDYQRQDLQLHLDLTHKRAWGLIDEHLGSIEACIQIILQYALRQTNGLLVHASAAYALEQTWLMPGISGTGKSTAARLGGFEIILSDEMVAVTPNPILFNQDLMNLSSFPRSHVPVGLTQSPSPYVVWATPFWSQWPQRSSTQWPQQTLALPLDLIVLLKQSIHVSRQACHAATAIRHLMSCVTDYEVDLLSHEHLFEISCQVVQHTAHAYVYFTKEKWRHLLD